MSAHHTEEKQLSPEPGRMTPAWSRVVRVVHWTLVAGFVVAFITEEEALQLHVWAGYAAAAAVLVRIAWGIGGPARERLSEFYRSPGEVLRYVRDALTGRSKRYMGHTPAGAVMAAVLLLSMAATTGTGMVVLAQSRDAGPLAPWFGKSAGQAQISLITPALADGGRERREHGGDIRSPMKHYHEFLANLTLALVGLHLTGVLLASLSHRENLVRGMITGTKPVEPS
jgi:cytochrome b